MKYIKKFDTTTLYNNATLDLPNVSLTMDDREVHYNPYDGRLITKYNVTSTSSSTKILYSSSNISSIEIDGTTLNNVVTTYTFSTTGEHIVKYTLTDNTIISTDTFYYLTNLTNIIIPSSITSIGDYAFGLCTGLTSLTIPSSITSIGREAFQGCSSLTSVTIPSSVTSIGNQAFESCSNLTLTVQATTPPTLGTNALNLITSLTIYVPAESVDTYKSASGWSNYANKIQAI